MKIYEILHIKRKPITESYYCTTVPFGASDSAGTETLTKTV